MKVQSLLVIGSLCVGCGAESFGPEVDLEEAGEQQGALSNKDFDVSFTDCAELAGIGFVSAAEARPLVPAHYALAGDANDAIVVVRVASCQGAVIDGKSSGPTITSQVGIMLAGGDPTADINNYTVAYATNQARLHARFQAAGLSSDNTKDLSLKLTSDQLSASSASPHTSRFQVSGTASVPTSAPTTFTAAWWGDGRHGTVRSRTVFPTIRFGEASTTLSTPSNTELADLLNGTTLTFPILDSYNTFASAQLAVSVTD